MNGARRKAGGPLHTKQSWQWARLRKRGSWLAVLMATALGILATLCVARAVRGQTFLILAAGAQQAARPGHAPDSAVFTPAHRSFLDAVKEYFGVQSTPVQPIAFTHKIHIQNGLQCTNCHAGVTQGPDAGYPSVTFCMACHQAIAADKPEIKKLTAYAAKGQEPPWQRVYWFYPTAHVRFQHAPHIRNDIACEQCHGDLAQQTVAVKTKDLNMNFCLTCHKAKGVSVDCITCHN